MDDFSHLNKPFPCGFCSQPQPCPYNYTVPERIVARQFYYTLALDLLEHTGDFSILDKVWGYTDSSIVHEYVASREQEWVYEFQGKLEHLDIKDKLQGRKAKDKEA